MSIYSAEMGNASNSFNDEYKEANYPIISLYKTLHGLKLKMCDGCAQDCLDKIIVVETRRDGRFNLCDGCIDLLYKFMRENAD